MYRSSFRSFLLPLPLLILLRAALKLLLIDPATGFYEGAPLLPWAFSAVTVLSVLMIAYASWRESDPGMRVLRGSRTLEIAGFLLGLVILGVGVLLLLSLPGDTRVYNVLPRWMRAAEYVFAAAAGISLLWIAALSGDSSKASRKGCLSLLVCLWQALYLLERFMSFRQVATVSDQLLETLFWTASLVFWTHHARCLAGEGASRRRTVALGLAAPVFGIPCAVGRLAALFFTGGEEEGTLPACILMLAVALYEAIFAAVCAHSPSEGERF